MARVRTNFILLHADIQLFQCNFVERTVLSVNLGTLVENLGVHALSVFLQRQIKYFIDKTLIFHAKWLSNT
jgi:hypothetical protein